MYPLQYTYKSYLATGTTGLTGAAPLTGAGNAVTMADVQDGTLAARVYAKATTNTLTIAAKWQALDDDGTTWIDCVESNNPANVVMVTGTGSAVTATKLLAAPAAVYGRRQARLVVLTAAATGGGAGTDEYSIAYDYRKPFG